MVEENEEMVNATIGNTFTISDVVKMSLREVAVRIIIGIPDSSTLRLEQKVHSTSTQQRNRRELAGVTHFQFTRPPPTPVLGITVYYRSRIKCLLFVPKIHTAPV